MNHGIVTTTHRRSMMSQRAYRAYCAHLRTLTADELTNERYTLVHENHIIGLPDWEAADKTQACIDEMDRRLVVSEVTA